MKEINDLNELPKQRDKAYDIHTFYEDISLSVVHSYLNSLVALWEKNGAPSNLGFIEVPLIRAYASKLRFQNDSPDKALLERCRIFNLDQANYVIESFSENYEIELDICLKMSKKKIRPWKELPKDYDDPQKIASFYNGKNVEDIVQYMKSVVAEWNLQWNDPIRDESVRSVELPLINAFRDKAIADDIKRNSDLLYEFQICDNGDAVNAARELLGLEPTTF
jgi:hypothetical protein